MNLKIISWSIIILLLFTGTSIIPASYMSNTKHNVLESTITVDDDGNADYSCIQEAINNAKSGDTIYIYKGNYLENLVIDKSIVLQGEDKSSTIIKGDFLDDTVWIKASFVEIKNLKIRESINDGYSAGIRVIEKRWYHADDPPDVISNIKISNCEIENNNCGIRFSNVKESEIISCNINNNLCSSVYFCTANNIKIKNCDIFENGLKTTYGYYTGGIVLTNGYGKSKNIEISDCRIYDNIYSGISVNSIENVVIENNYITNNSNMGVEIKNTKNKIELVDNHINNNGNYNRFDSGIFLQDNSNVTLDNNKIYDNKKYGIYLLRCSLVNVKINTIKRNDYGIYIKDSFENLIIENDISISWSIGLSVKGNKSKENRIFHNNFHLNLFNAECSSEYNNGYQEPPMNYWDNGTEGNYWDDFDRPIEGAYDKNNDGIIDSSYTIDVNNTDNYPLKNSYGKNKLEIKYKEIIHSNIKSNRYIIEILDILYNKIQELKNQR